jgi:flagellar biosynthetic protein FlhB
MAKDGHTEKATPRRKKKAREEGNVLKSKETSNFMSIASLALVLIMFGEWFVGQIKNILILGLTIVKQGVMMDSNAVFQYLTQLGIESFKIIVMVAIIVLSFQFLNYFITVRFLIAWKAIKPDLKKLDPRNYFKNLFSRRTVVEVIKSIILFLILGYITYFVLRQEVSEISGAMLLPWQDSLTILWGVFKSILIKILIVLFVIAVLDYFYQKWEYEDKLKMQKHELREEHKEHNGNPEVKSRQKKVRIAMLKNEIITQTPKATFIAVNPTHYSVAIRYEKGVDPVPKVLVKGTDHLALYIREIAKEHNIPIVENPPLARELYARVDNNEFIPEDMFLSVISVLHYLINTKKIKMKQ